MKSPRSVISSVASAAAFTVMLAGCQSSDDTSTEASAVPEEVVETPVAVVEAVDPASAALAAILAEQPEAVQARYAARHPQETLEFFGIKPGMSVLEALPGGGWYTKILLPYLGTDGTLVGADYDKTLFPLFGFFSEERLKEKETWVEDWRAEAEGWFDGGVADVDAMQFGSLPGHLEGELDAVLLIRALHNLARFENDGQFLTAALADINKALKPGGIVGVVQHMAPEEAPDTWADGSAGYLKKSFVVAQMEETGLEFVAESAINENPADQPTTDDIVWRLPPTLATSKDNPELAEQLKAVGESTRMTLLFKKPANTRG
ncbi:MAG: class I SAM-dependent methyltransferase [Congregibacter sp.]